VRGGIISVCAVCADAAHWNSAEKTGHGAMTSMRMMHGAMTSMRMMHGRMTSMPMTSMRMMRIVLHVVRLCHASV